MLTRRSFLRRSLAGGVAAIAAPSLLAQIPQKQMVCSYGSIAGSYVAGVALKVGDVVYLSSKTGCLEPCEPGFAVPIGVCTGPDTIKLSNVLDEFGSGRYL